MKQKYLFFGLTVILAVFLLFTIFNESKFEDKSIEDKRAEFISERDNIIQEQIVLGHYACCLHKPCTYCIEKTPGHGEGAKCRCLDDVMNGRHPCGECIGEIMEGHGNPYLSKYFAKAIAEEVGENHTAELKEIMYEKYGTPIEEQE